MQWFGSFLCGLSRRIVVLERSWKILQNSRARTVYCLLFTVVISPPRTIGRRFTSSRTGGRQISSVRLALTLNFRISLCGGPSLGPKSRRGNHSRRAETSSGSNHA